MPFKDILSRSLAALLFINATIFAILEEDIMRNNSVKLY